MPLERCLTFFSGSRPNSSSISRAGLVVPGGEARLAEADGFTDAHPAVDSVRLGDVADAPFDFYRIELDVDAQDAGCSRGGREHSHQHFDGGALAGAVGAEQAEGAAAGDREREVVDGQRAAEALGEIEKLDGRAVLIGCRNIHGRLLPVLAACCKAASKMD